MNQAVQMMNAEEPNNNQKTATQTLLELAGSPIGQTILRPLLKTPHGRTALAAIAAISMAGTMTYDWLQAKKAKSGLQPA